MTLLQIARRIIWRSRGKGASFLYLCGVTNFCLSAVCFLFLFLFLFFKGFLLGEPTHRCRTISDNRKLHSRTRILCLSTTSASPTTSLAV